MKKDILRVGIVGFGIVGQRRMHFIDQNPNLETVAICDVRFKSNGTMIDGSSFNYNYNSLEEESKQNPISGVIKKNLKYYNNYVELLEDNIIDVLFVSVPNYLSPEVTIAGLRKNLHVFCEKPPGRSVDDIKKVREIEKLNPSLKLKYGFNHRYHGSIKDTKKIITGTDFGSLITMRGVYGKSSIVPFESGQWRSIKKYAGGGILLDQGIHMLDMFRYFSGDFSEVKAFVSNKYWNHDVEDNVSAIMRNNNGVLAQIHSSATLWQHSFNLEITLENAFLSLSGILSGSKSYGQERLLIIPKQEDSIVGSLKSSEINYLEDTSWNDEILEFTELIFNDAKVEQGNSYDALKVMELIEQIYSSDDKWNN